MKKFVCLTLFLLVQILCTAQSGPVYILPYGGPGGNEQIELDSVGSTIIYATRNFGNNSALSKSTLEACTFIQNNYNVSNIHDSIRSVKYDGTHVYVCYPTQILKITDAPVPGVVWTYSNSMISTTSTSLSSASNPRFMNMDLRNDTLFVLYNDGVIRPIMLHKNTLANVSPNDFNNTSTYICSSTVPCLKTVGMKLFGNKLFVFGSIQNSSNDYGVKLFSFDITNGTLNASYPLFYSYTFSNSGFVNDIAFYNTKIYVGGSFSSVNGNPRKSLAIFDLNFNLLTNSIPYTVFDNTTELQGIRRMQLYGNVLITLGVYHSINNINVTTNTTTPHFCQNYFNLNTNYILPISTSTLVDLYPICAKVELKVAKLYLYNGSHLNTNVNNNSMFNMPPMTYGQHILYPGANSLTTNSNITVCVPDNGSITFTAPIKYNCTTYSPFTTLANSWSYSGTGATIMPFNNGANAKVVFSANATSGILSVTGSNSNGQVSETMKLLISVMQKPTVTSLFVGTDSISCKRPKIPITFTMNPSSVFTPTWTCPDNTFKYNVNDSTKKFLSGYYKITVMGNNGCLNSDSILAKIDTLKPNVTLPSSQVYIKCVPDSSLLQGSTTSTGSIVWWRNALGNTIKYQPYYVKTIGNYYFVAKTLQNGCKDSSLYQVKDQTAPPNSKLTSHAYLNPFTAIDTITCYNNNTIISGASDTLNTIIKWRDITTSTFSNNPISINSQGNFKLYVNRADNGCADSSKIIFVAQNNLLPGIYLQQANPSINCSFNTATLNATSSNTAVNLTWIAPSSNTLSNPAIVNALGKYYIQAIDPSNNCSKLDSVTLIQTNSLVVDAGLDIKVCKNSNVNLNATTMGTLTGITYSWNQGSTTPNINVNVNSSAQFIVMANGPGGCFGSDTVKVIIPPDIQDSLVAFQNCDNTSLGSVLAYAKGGIAPYKFSIDNGNTYTTGNVFTNKAFGNYTILIKDSIGCIRSGTVSVNGNSNLPVPKFIASTFNFSSDTIVLVDLSNPRPDSVHWQLPPQMSKIGGTMFSPVVIVSDTGDYTVTMFSFYGSCILNTTKNIHFAPGDSIHATALNAHGIKKVVIYPNPNTGAFTVDVVFYKKQNSSIQVWDASPYKHFQQNFYETDLISLPVNISQLTNGSYILKVIGEYDARTIPFIINK